MKKLLILFFIFLTLKGLAQNCKNPDPTAPAPKPRGSIDSREARNRIDDYIVNKNKGRVSDSLIYDPRAFLELLEYLTDSSKHYNGVRIYFAADTIKTDELVLVFVPTRETDIGDITINRDDTSSCYTIVNKNAKHLLVRDARKFINTFQTNHLSYFTNDGLLGNSGQRPPITKFQEATSIWYDISIFKGGINLNTNTIGMKKLLQCLINQGSVDSVVMNLATFDHSPASPYNPPLDFFYHLMLIFGFYKDDTVKALYPGNNPIIIAFESYLNELEKLNINKASFSKDQKEIVKYFLSNFGYTDTGVPCPPPPPNKTCDQIGPLLP
jgi:hypothetical protein